MIPAGNPIDTRLYEKALNLYLYLPPASAHPPGVLKGLIYGGCCRIHRLTTCPLLRRQYVQRFYERLLARGYASTTVVPLINTAVSRLSAPTTPLVGTAPPLRPLFLHVDYHPEDSTSQDIQRAFRCDLLQPRNPDCPFDRLTVAYHRPQNLGNLVSPRRLPTTGISVSEVLARDFPPAPLP